MFRKSHTLLAILFILFGVISQAQTSNDNKLHLTTGVGVNMIQGVLGKTFRSTVAFNSGVEKTFPHHWFGQAEVNFNTLRYDQQVKDENSQYLFQNTNSSLLMLGINGGKDFLFGNSLWFGSAYIGTGYINIGEPRISVDEINEIVVQSVVRKGGILGKVGGRIGINTRSRFLQTLYIDGSYWTSSLRTQERSVNSFSLFIGMRMTMQ